MANTTRNGYEIRADLLGLAKQIAEFNYSIKLNEFETSVRKDGEKVVTEFKYPAIQAEDIIATAQKFNDFVTNSVPQGNETAKILMENMQNYTSNIQKQLTENMKPEKVQENLKTFQDNIKKASEAFFNGVQK
jgi:hypothetical protein